MAKRLYGHRPIMPYLLFALSLSAIPACAPWGFAVDGKGGSGPKELAVTLLAGVFWTTAYALAIRRGFVDKTYGVPLLAVCANIAWELLYCTVLGDSSPVGSMVSAIWLALDAVILFQCFKYRSREIPGLPAWAHAILVAGAIGAFVALLYWAEKKEIYMIHSAFAQLALMSVLFIAMLFVRKDGRGQSVYIAAAMLIGNAAPIVGVFSQARPQPLWSRALLVTTLGLNALYLVMLAVQLRRRGIRPFRRL